MDLVVPVGDALDHALAVAGVRLGPGDRVFGPGGTTVEPGTQAAELREGGLYAIASARAAIDEDRRRRGARSGVRLLPWGVVAGALAAAVIAVASDSAMQRNAAALIVGVAAFVLALGVAASPGAARVAAEANRAEPGENEAGTQIFPALLLGAIAGVLAAPRGADGIRGPLWDAMLACSLGFAGIALIAVLLSALARARVVRAGAATAALIATVAAILAAACPLIGWGAREFFIVAAGASVLMIRALPALLVNVDEGYSIDYGRYMALRWTVRGRVPRYIERVDGDEVLDMVAVTESRLRTATVMFAVLAVPGMALAVEPLSAGNLVERIGAGVFVCFAITALLLVSRRTVAPMLKRPQRVAALAGVLGAAVMFAVAPGVPVQWLLPAAGVLLFAGVAVGAGSVALQRGARSLGWSRTGDIVEAFAVAMVLPAGLLAAGAIDVLRGVLS